MGPLFQEVEIFAGHYGIRYVAHGPFSQDYGTFFLFSDNTRIVLFIFFSERYMISLSQHCLPKDPEKINQCFAVFAVSIQQYCM